MKAKAIKRTTSILAICTLGLVGFNAYRWTYDYTSRINACANRYQNAAQIIKVCTELLDNPKFSASNQATFLSERAWAHQRKRNLAAALSDIENAVSLYPNSRYLWVDKAQLLNADHQYDLAEQSFQRAIALDPKHVTTQYLRAKLLKNRGMNAEALAGFEMALELEPAHKLSNWQVINIHINTREFDKAVKRLNFAVQHWPEDLEIRQYLGILHLQHTHNYPLAVTQFEAFESIAPESLMGPLLLAATYYASGDIGLAETYVDRVVEQLVTKDIPSFGFIENLMVKASKALFFNVEPEMFFRAVVHSILGQTNLAKTELSKLIRLPKGRGREFIKHTLKQAGYKTDPASIDQSLDDYINTLADKFPLGRIRKR